MELHNTLWLVQHTLACTTHFGLSGKITDPKKIEIILGDVIDFYEYYNCCESTVRPKKSNRHKYLSQALILENVSSGYVILLLNVSRSFQSKQRQMNKYLSKKAVFDRLD